MRGLIAILFLVGSVRALLLDIDVVEIYKHLTTIATLAVENGLNGYNPYLTSEQVVHFSCAKPSDKIFTDVYFDDPDMATKLDLSKPIGFLTHGWTENGYTRWMMEVSETWVQYHDTNVCRMDWSIYSMVIYAVAAQRNVYLVSDHLAKFIRSLHDVHGVAYNDVTIIGHSLGGQICGITGYNLGGQLGRLIALDPANVYFTFPYSIPLEKQLDKSDAQFVTVIHSNGYMVGVGYSVGHADYYPNGGASIQPGCVFPFVYGIYSIEYGPILCSHFRAVRYLHLSLNNDPLCLAVKCNSYSDYLQRTCTTTTDTWGINSKRIEGDFYFWTGFNPKCLNKYWPF